MWFAALMPPTTITTAAAVTNRSVVRDGLTVTVSLTG
jgi:hypothetical protein